MNENPVRRKDLGNNGHYPQGSLRLIITTQTQGKQSEDKLNLPLPFLAQFAIPLHKLRLQMPGKNLNT